MSIVQEGKNAWRIASAHRSAFLIDGAAYFEAVAEAFERAEKSIFILAWDINSEIALRRNQGASPSGSKLGSLLQQALESHPRLHIYVLVWDFAMIYALERDLMPLFDLAWSRERRLHFHMDNRHPVGACHHQKIVVVDDAVAFVGGFDLTKERWDTPEHEAKDPRRTDTGEHLYPPFHDIQMAVDGDAAQVLAELARGRWKRATDNEARDTGPGSDGAWPSSVQPCIENVDIAIARTCPAYGDEPQIKEVEQLYVDGIAAAKRSIYIENQYFTSSRITEALAARLRESAGPEMVAVLPHRCPGWLEENTMGFLRNKALQTLAKADRARRFRAYYPSVPASDACDVFVHSKMMIVDDRFLVLGSANLSNRSMGLDTECTLAVEDSGGSDLKGALARLRARLLAEHLGVSASEWEDARRDTGSLVDSVESLRGKPRTLQPLEPSSSEWPEPLASSISVVDPENPIGPDDLIEHFVSPASVQPRQRWRRAGLLLLVLLGLSAVWRWTPLADAVNADSLQGWGSQISSSPFAPAIVIGGYALAGLLMVPLTALILATAVTFPPLTAFTYSVLGAMASAVLTYGIGHAVGRNSIRRMAGSKLNLLSRRLAKEGVLAMAAVRLVPVAPFTVVNLVAGASHIRFQDFLLGSLMGLLPGILAITVLEHRIEELIREPGAHSAGILIAVALVVVGGIVWLRRRLTSG